MTSEPSRFDRVRRNDAVRRLASFFGASAVGLAIDLGIFAVLTMLGVEPWLANGISATTSITAVYLIATRRTFATRARALTYVAFVAWYTTSIVTFSFLIDFAAGHTGSEPMLWKLASVPVSFLLNFGFSTLLFRRKNPAPLSGARGKNRPDRQRPSARRQRRPQP